MDASLSKSELRRRFRAIRNGIPQADRDVRSRQLADRLVQVPEVQKAVSVFVYVASGSEVDTCPLIDALLRIGKRVAVPRVLSEPGRMQAVAIASRDELVLGRYKLLEPLPDAPVLRDPDLVLTPGLAFTPAGERLGQGGGYYDRYLALHPSSLAIGLAFSEQLADRLPAESHDAVMDRVAWA